MNRFFSHHWQRGQWFFRHFAVYDDRERLVIRYFLAGLAFFICTMTLRAEETTQWRALGNWHIIVDHSLSGACFAGQVYSDGSVLRVGLLTPNADGPMYFAVGHVNWQSIKAGQDYEIYAQLDRGRQVQLPSVGQGVNGINFLVSKLTDAKFLYDIMMRNRLNIYFQGQTIANFSLRGSKRAILELVNCQKANHRAAPRDPFARQ